MVAVSFQNWWDALAAAELAEKTRASHKVIILWYLGHLKRSGEPASVASARAFVEGLLEERRPSEWQFEQWREGLNWFFRNAPVRRRVLPGAEGGGRGAEGWGEREMKTKREMKREGGMNDGGPRGAEASGSVSPSGDGRRRYDMTIRELQSRVPANPLLEDTIRLMRVRQMAYRTEETYVGWLRRGSAEGVRRRSKGRVCGGGFPLLGGR
jgi:hypothetical protein